MNSKFSKSITKRKAITNEKYFIIANGPTLQENIMFLYLKVPIYVVWQHKTKTSTEKPLSSSRKIRTINYRNIERKA